MEKNEKIKKITKIEYVRFAAIIGVLCLILLGLCAYIFVDFRLDSRAAESRKMLLRTGMTGSARAVSEDIGSGNMILAYHHAAEASEYAALLGDDGGERMFREISSAILDGTLDAGVTADIDGFVVSGVVPEKIPLTESETDRGVPTSVQAYGDAAKCAERFFGGAVVAEGVRCPSGDILFSVSNAYALIDGNQMIPIEAAISLDEGSGTMSDGECAASAMKFVADFFPREVSAHANIIEVRDADGKAEITAQIEDKIMTFTVRRDSGRVVRFISRQR